MLRTVAEYGLLATVLLLVLVVGEHAQFLKPPISSWIVGGAAAIVLAVGVWLGRRHFTRHAPGPHGTDSGDAADPQEIAARPNASASANASMKY